MTQSYYAKNILNIKDENVYFYENCLKTRKKGILNQNFNNCLIYTTTVYSICNYLYEFNLLVLPDKFQL